MPWGWWFGGVGFDVGAEVGVAYADDAAVSEGGQRAGVDAAVDGAFADSEDAGCGGDGVECRRGHWVVWPR